MSLKGSVIMPKETILHEVEEKEERVVLVAVDADNSDDDTEK